MQEAKSGVSVADPTADTTPFTIEADDDSLRHIGAMAQDFYAAFGLGTDEKHITPLDANGIALAAIQGLNTIRKQQAEEIEMLRETNADL